MSNLNCRNKMHINKIVNELSYFRDVLIGINNDAIRKCHTHSYILEQWRDRMLDTDRFKNLPRYAQSELIGFHYGWLESIYRHFTSSGYMIDGKFVACFSEELPQYYQRIHDEKISCCSTWNKDTSKPFS